MTNMTNLTAPHTENNEPHHALAEPSPSIAAACAAMRSATSPTECSRGQQQLWALVDSHAPLSPVDQAAVAVALAGVFAHTDRGTQLQIILHAADRARRAGALRASLHALREAQMIEYDVNRERLMDEITSDLVCGRYHAAPPTETTQPPTESDAGHQPTTSSSSPATPPKTKSGAGKNKKKKKNDKNAAAATDVKTTEEKVLSPAPSASNDRPLIVARAMDRLTATDLARVPAGPSMAFVTVLSASTDGFLGMVEIAYGSHSDRTWRCPRCGSGVRELHVTGSRRLECAACRDRVRVDWRTFGPEVTGLIERMVRGEDVPTQQLIDAVARYTEANS